MTNVFLQRLISFKKFCLIENFNQLLGVILIISIDKSYCFTVYLHKDDL